MKADFHMHTNFSSDATYPLEEMIEGAIKKGLKTICITDHEDLDWPNSTCEGEFQIDLETYVSTIHQLKETYKERIEVLMGIEFGLQTHLGETYKKIATTYPFDYIIGSIHILDGVDPYGGKFFSGEMTDEKGYHRAFEITLENLKQCEDFDALGHMDYVVRYSKGRETSYHPKEYMEKIDEILKVLIQHNKALEFNTGGWKYGLPFAHPHQEILKRYKELGGEMITIGSDAHRPEHIAYDFHKVSDVLKACGFKYYTEFRQRKPYFCALL